MGEYAYIVPARLYVVQRLLDGKWGTYTHPVTMQSAKSISCFASLPTRILYVGRKES